MKYFIIVEPVSESWFIARFESEDGAILFTGGGSSLDEAVKNLFQEILR